MTDTMRQIVLEERLSRGLDVAAEDLEFLARRKRKRTTESAGDDGGKSQACPMCGGTGRVRITPVDDDDDEEKDNEDRKGLYGYDEEDDD